MSDDKSRARLGRGLASLIGSASGRAGAGVFPAAPGGIAPAGERLVDPSALSPNPKNPRRTFHAQDLEELTASIRRHGLVQPILVRRRAGDGPAFEIVAGERRWRAARAAGLSQVPIVVRDIGDREMLEIAIIENVQRADLDAIEEAMGYEALIEEHGYTQGDLGEVLGKSRSHVANTLRLLKLPQVVREMVTRGELSAGAARTAVSADDPEAFARRIVEGGMSVREAEGAARVSANRPAREAGKAKASQPPAPGAAPVAVPAAPARLKDTDTLALERLLTETLAMPVAIELDGGGGRLAVEFGDLDQLDELCRLLQTRRRAETAPRIREL